MNVFPWNSDKYEERFWGEPLVIQSWVIRNNVHDPPADTIFYRFL